MHLFWDPGAYLYFGVRGGLDGYIGCCSYGHKRFAHLVFPNHPAFSKPFFSPNLFCPILFFPNLFILFLPNPFFFDLVICRALRAQGASCAPCAGMDPTQRQVLEAGTECEAIGFPLVKGSVWGGGSFGHQEGTGKGGGKTENGQVSYISLQGAGWTKKMLQASACCVFFSLACVST